MDTLDRSIAFLELCARWDIEIARVQRQRGITKYAKGAALRAVINARNAEIAQMFPEKNG